MSPRSSSADPVVDIQHFRMSFGGKVVVKDLSFTVQRGEIFGFLGSNGSGKTTTLRALLGIYQPTSGKLLINGKPFSVDRGSKHRLPAGGARGYIKKSRLLMS